MDMRVHLEDSARRNTPDPDSRAEAASGMRKSCIIIPCYNEAGRLNAGEFLEWAGRRPDPHFLFVNDGSTDGTGGILDRLSRACPGQIRHITMERNRGKAEAVRRGFLESFVSGYNVIGYWDADMATPLETIPRFCDLLEDAEVDGVIGSRVMLLGRHIRRNPLRHYVGRVFATCASLAIGLPVYDTQCGAKVFRNTERLRQVFHTPFRVNWTFDVEILARFLLLERIFGGPATRDRFVEYPLERWEDVPGSKLKGRDFLLCAWEILRIAYMFRGPRAERRFLATLQKDGSSQNTNGITR
jgi:dolichyl-phosphate beta-glucosyltransferase